MVEDRANREQIMQYLEDLADIALEHAERCAMCMNSETSGHCVMKATISVEIMTYRIKFGQTL